jgi:hypothetical protein
LASPTPPPKSINIHSAIAAAPEALLKEALELLWANVPEARGWIDFAHREQISETERGLQAKWPKKIAGTCNEEYHYDVEELKHGMCRYHDGKFSGALRLPFRIFVLVVFR